MIADTLRCFFVQYRIHGPILVAVSGGGDSTALLVALAEMGDVALVAAHVNHGLRGTDSDADESFVRDLCRDMRVSLRVVDGTLDPQDVRQSGVEAAERVPAGDRGGRQGIQQGSISNCADLILSPAIRCPGSSDAACMPDEPAGDDLGEDDPSAHRNG